MTGERIKCEDLECGTYRFSWLFMTEMNAWLPIRPGDFSPLMRRFFLIFGLVLSGCESTPHRAPVVDRGGEQSEAVASTDSGLQTEVKPFNAYTVQKGDTLFSIAQSNGISQKDLAGWNNIQDPAAIQVGQQLWLSPRGQMDQPSLYALPEPGLSPPGRVESAGAAAPSEARPLGAGGKLKTEPKALKVPYSEQAVALLKGYDASPQTVAARVEALMEKNPPAEAGITPPSPVAATPLPASPPTSPIPEPILAVDQIEWIWPTKGKLLEGFSEGTKGIDISGTPGQAVIASAAGKVVYSGGGLRGYGKLIIIKHNSTYLSAYAHNNKLLVKEGQTVVKGQKIAEMGSSDSSLVKLHFEIRKNGKPVDPLKHLPSTSG
jgi:lipoprotein NlpD